MLNRTIVFDFYGQNSGDSCCVPDYIAGHTQKSLESDWVEVSLLGVNFSVWVLQESCFASVAYSVCDIWTVAPYCIFQTLSSLEKYNS